MSLVKAKKAVTENKSKTVKKKEVLKREVIVQHAGKETKLGQIIEKIKELMLKDWHYGISEIFKGICQT